MLSSLISSIMKSTMVEQPLSTRSHYRSLLQRTLPVGERYFEFCQLEWIFSVPKDGKLIVSGEKEWIDSFRSIPICWAEEFRMQLIYDEGSANIFDATLSPIDWGTSLFSEDDNRHDLKNKIYLPLSRTLRRHGGLFRKERSRHVCGR